MMYFCCHVAIVVIIKVHRLYQTGREKEREEYLFIFLYHRKGKHLTVIDMPSVNLGLGMCHIVLLLLTISGKKQIIFHTHFCRYDKTKITNGEHFY